MLLITKKGFTLLEVLVAMAILSVVVVAIYTSFRGGTDSWTRGRAMSEITQNARVTLEIIARELSCAIISIYTDLDNISAQQDFIFAGKDNGNSDILDFTAMLRSPDSSDKYKFGLVEIGYNHDSVNNKIERRIDVTPLWDTGLSDPDPDPFAGGSTDDLAYNVTKLNFRYIDSGGTYYTDWDTRVDGEMSVSVGNTYTIGSPYYDDNTFPSAVEITITVVDDTTTPTITKEYSTIVYLSRSEAF